jgi:hypothetical protein
MPINRFAAGLFKDHRITCSKLGAATLLLLMALTPPCVAQSIIAYPARGQSPEQQERDRYDCFNWAVQQTGYNPEAQQFASSAPPPTMGGGFLRGGFGGAALGAIGGAIGGNAGEGAAIGAAVGGLFGGFRRREMEIRQEEMEQQQAAAHAQRFAVFRRAEAACLEGRGYSVD